ncbi:MAG: MAPEG family protein [Polyangiaceae bacterium]
MDHYPAFGVYCYFAVGLVTLLFLLDGLSSVVRVRTKTAINPEDVGRTAGASTKVVDEEVAAVQRATRVWRNAFANIVPFLIIAFLFVLTRVERRDALIYFSVFSGARVLHAVVYMLGKQPWRTIFFVVGQAATLGIAYHVVRYAAALP